MRNFRELTIWNEGMGLVVELYRITKLLPREEEYGLKSQIRRAAISIPSNIAEGCSRNSQKEFKHYLEISLGSAFEVETNLILATRLSMISDKDILASVDALQILQRRINSLIGAVKQF